MRKYAAYYQGGELPYVGDYIISILDKGVDSYEAACDEFQMACIRMRTETDMLNRQFLWSLRDGYMYALQDWQRLDRKGENIFEIFSLDV